MKSDIVFLISVLLLAIVTGCKHKSFEDQFETEAKKQTAKMCPMQVAEGVTLDSIVFSITIYGDPKSFGEIQKHLEENGYEVVGAEFTYVPNDLKDVTPEQRETIDKMVERLEEFDDVQTVYTNMKPEAMEE